MKQMLNLGCGTRIHPNWINVDLVPSTSNVIAYDLRLPLPFPDDYFDVVYHSHVLEHFNRVEGQRFLTECYRVCRPGGVLRVVVPDLETIVRLYLKYLEDALRGETQAHHRYNWMMFELFDQMVRSRTGGDTAEYLASSPPELAEFLISRVGKEVYSSYKSDKDNSSHIVPRFLRLVTRPKRMWYYFRATITCGILGLLWSRSGRDITKEILFRQQGEVHRWMYDQYSIRKVLEQVGFSEVVIFSSSESRVEGWNSFGLDIEPDSTIYKPDSLFCEAVKLVNNENFTY
jgi:predicted SAM-dependent methyltransferase